MFLDVIGAELGECFARRDADGYRYADGLQNAPAQLPAPGGVIGNSEVSEVEERFVDGIHFSARASGGEGAGNPAGNVAVELEIAGKLHHTFAGEQLAVLKSRRTHRYTKRFGLVAACDDAAVVAGQHHDR